MCYGRQRTFTPGELESSYRKYVNVPSIFFLRRLISFTSVIHAVSTNTPNPLQALATLQSRSVDLPPWIDSVYLRFTLIVHSEKSLLNDEE